MTNLIGVLFVVAFAVYAIARLTSQSQAQEDDEWENPFAEQAGADSVKWKAWLFYLFIIVAVIIYYVSSYIVPFLVE